MTKIFGILAGLVLAMGVNAQGTGASETTFQEGVHYQKLTTPISTQSGNDVEIAEMFWYGCGHCYKFETPAKAWKKRLPEGVNFVAVPGNWQKQHAKLYYLADMLGVLDKAHGKVFEVMHNDPKRRPHQMLKSEKEMRNFFMDLGVSEEKFEKEFNGGSVKMAMAFNDSNLRSLTKQMAKAGTKVSTPSVIVNGKYYITLNKSVPQFTNMIKVADFLAAKELEAKKLAAAK